MFQKGKLEDSIHLRAVRFGAEHQHGFTYAEIEKKYKTHRPKDWKVVDEFLNEAVNNKSYKESVQRVTPFVVLDWGKNGNDRVFILSYEAYFNYLDFLELVQARKNANSAFLTALVALAISIFGMGASFF